MAKRTYDKYLTARAGIEGCWPYFFKAKQDFYPYILKTRGEINIPKLIESQNISSAWMDASNHILTQGNVECTDLMVHITNPVTTNPHIDQLYDSFCDDFNLTKHKKVATFIFPQRLHEICGYNRSKLYRNQSKVHNVVKGTWGSYFDQMVNWKEQNGNTINQIETIIRHINQRERVYKTAYTIQITNPFFHINYTRGGPCLRYITLQLHPEPRKMSLLALYRNHDFARRAYGNYLGLGNLLKFLASETGFELGTVTCVSSSAYIGSIYRSELHNIVVGVRQ